MTRRPASLVCLGLAAAALPLWGCSSSSHSATHSGTPSGDALQLPVPSTAGFGHVHTGSEYSLIFAGFGDLKSAQPITLVRVALGGKGVGKVVRILKASIVRTEGGLHSISYGSFLTSPPVQFSGGSCHVAVLRPVHGYRLNPGDWVRLDIVFKLLSAGEFHVPQAVVYYRMGSTLVRQTVPAGFAGRAIDAGPVPRASSTERPCLSQTHLLHQSA